MTQEDQLLNEAAAKYMKSWNLGSFKRSHPLLYRTFVEAIKNKGTLESKVAFDLNDECKTLLSRVERVFLFDDDATSLLMYQIFDKQLTRTVGMRTFKSDNSMCSQISFYTMPSGKICACAYPSSVKVDYDLFREEMNHVFEHVKDKCFSGEPYAFLLFCKTNGYKLKNSE